MRNNLERNLDRAINSLRRRDWIAFITRTRTPNGVRYLFGVSNIAAISQRGIIHIRVTASRSPETVIASIRPDRLRTLASASRLEIWAYSDHGLHRILIRATRDGHNATCVHCLPPSKLHRHLPQAMHYPTDTT